jgi:hypothetical protein
MSQMTSPQTLAPRVHFYASFDEEVRGDFGRGDLAPQTRFDHPTGAGGFEFVPGYDPEVLRIARGQGIVGGALEGLGVLPRRGRVFFPAAGNLPYRADGWEGTLSFWLHGDPNELLQTSYCDPVQITQRGANDGGLWVDFNNATPRDLRAGAFPARVPGGRVYTEQDPDTPLIPISNLAWTGWRHVAVAWKNLDTGRADAEVTLYLDGEEAGALRDREIAMRWDLARTGIYVAIAYIGLMDELAIFDRCFGPETARALAQEPDLAARAVRAIGS